ERKGWHLRQPGKAGIAGKADDGSAADLLLKIRGGGVVRFEQGGAKREVVRLVRLRVSRRPFRIAGYRHRVQIRQHRDGREAVRQRGGVEDRLEGRPRLAAAPSRTIERRLSIVAAADH